MNGTVRRLVVWGMATLLAGALLTWLLPGIGAAAAGSGGFVALLVTGSALVGAGCVGWLWFLVTLVVVEAHRGRPTRTAVPVAVRRIVLAACGISLAGGLIVPAHADQSAPPPESGRTTTSLLVGLPLPDLTTSTTAWLGAVTAPATISVRPERPARPSVRVAPGDTLWDLAEATLPPGADAAAIDRRWREIYRANTTALGVDPDLIRPGQRLLLPPTGVSHR